MFKIYFIILFFSLTGLFSQNHFVLDSVDKKIIPFATILNSNTNEGVICNESGEFSVEGNKTDVLEFRCLGYETKYVLLKEITDTILLKPKYFEIEEVKISNKKSVNKEIGIKRKRMNWFLGNKNQIGTLLKPNKELAESKINKISIPINIKNPLSKKDSIELDKNFNSILKIQLFSNKNETPDKILLSAV